MEEQKVSQLIYVIEKVCRSEQYPEEREISILSLCHSFNRLCIRTILIYSI